MPLGDYLRVIQDEVAHIRLPLEHNTRKRCPRHVDTGHGSVKVVTPRVQTHRVRPPFDAFIDTVYIAALLVGESTNWKDLWPRCVSLKNTAFLNTSVSYLPRLLLTALANLKTGLLYMTECPWLYPLRHLLGVPAINVMNVRHFFCRP